VLEKLISREVKILTIDEKAMELGKMISLSDEFQAVRQAESALRGDAEGFKMVEEFQVLQRNLEQMQRSGQQMTGDNYERASGNRGKGLAKQQRQGLF